MNHHKVSTPKTSKEQVDLIKSAFGPGTQAAQAVLAYARICGVGEITQKIGSGYDTFERGMFEGRRSAMIDLMNLAGIDPLTAFKPNSTQTPETGD